MKISKNKSIASLIAATLTITIIVSIAISPAASAAYMRRYADMAYVSVAPNTVGTGQNVLIAFWCDKLPPTAIGEYGDRWTFDVNIVKPDGSNDTITGIESDPVGAAYTTFTPTETGTYTIQAIMREHVIDGGQSRGLVSPAGVGWWPSGSPPNPNLVPPGWSPIGVVFEAALSTPVTLTVTDQQVPRYQETPLPNDYWTRPVYDANRGWSTYAMGQWLGASELNQYANGGRYDPYTTGPASSHILWTRPYFTGGIAGGVSTVNGSSPDNSYYSGQSYEGYGGPQIVMNGKIYYSVQTNPREGFYCVDLYTGETIYFRNTTGPVTGAGGAFSSTGSIPYGAPAFGQVLTYDSPNQHGTLSYYWVTATGKSATWDLYDDFSGNYICSINNIPTWVSGAVAQFGAAPYTPAVGTEGSILRYQVVNLGTTSSPKWYLQCWNTSQAIMYPNYQIHETGSGSNVNWMWRPELNRTYDGAYGYSANVSIPNFPLQSGATIRQVIPEDKLIVIYAGSNNGTVSVPGTVVILSLKPGQVGTILKNYNFTAPPNVGDAYGQAEQFSSKNTAFQSVNAEAGIFWYYDPMTLRYFVYDLETGNQLWIAPPAEQFQFYGGYTAVCYNGMFIDCGGYSGVVRAFDAKTGTFLWNWTAPSVGLDETPYQYSPLSYGFLTGDGLLYLYSSEHSVNNPIRRDAQIWCLNITSGKLVWMLTCWPSSAPIVADQRLLVVDSHDNELYCFGKGPSATTVSAPQTVPALGASVMITGTVTDQTQTGRRNLAGSVDFSLKGTPAISDEYMDAWMEYMFHQRPMPTNAKGVDVELHAIDPNGNWIPIGTATSDSAGKYGISFKPEVPGTYQIVAEFKGSNSYGPSFGTTYLAVGNEAPTAPPPTAQPQSIADMYFVPAIAGIIVAIIVVGAILALLLLRKRP
ncbi:MAG: PQQ-binding-like beta-propeller repeat protein [Candidatus Bathyarchaeota archaeon]|nr:PQQ-binding-like beta-propeller repeat protein [Candidatus Bathyarchaeota archaeon]